MLIESGAARRSCGGSRIKFNCSQHAWIVHWDGEERLFVLTTCENGAKWCCWRFAPGDEREARARAALFALRRRRFIVSAYQMRRYGAKMMYPTCNTHACCLWMNYARKKHPSRCQNGVAWEWCCSGRFCASFTSAANFYSSGSKFPFSAWYIRIGTNTKGRRSAIFWAFPCWNWWYKYRKCWLRFLTFSYNNYKSMGPVKYFPLTLQSN